ncbi:BPL-N domain-containing protein [Lacunimicrobium album]
MTLVLRSFSAFYGRPKIVPRLLAILILLTIQTAASAGPIWVAVYCHSDPTKNAGPLNLQRFLTSEKGYRCEIITPEEIQEGRLKAFDVLIVPGGSGSKQAEMLGETGRENIRTFVKEGGGYMGICAGSYLASSDYSWSLNLINAKVFDRAHWARGTGDVQLKLTTEGQKQLKEGAEEVTVYYGQGPLLVPDDEPNLPQYEALATYATEIAKKGAPTGVMVGTAAIARTTYGEGKVMCYSPHPEKSDKTEHLICGGLEWLVGNPDVLKTMTNKSVEDEEAGKQ